MKKLEQLEFDFIKEDRRAERWSHNIRKINDFFRYSFLGLLAYDMASKITQAAPQVYHTIENYLRSF